jgi:hypothetical protein
MIVFFASLIIIMLASRRYFKTFDDSDLTLFALGLMVMTMTGLRELGYLNAILPGGFGVMASGTLGLYLLGRQRRSN